MPATTGPIPAVAPGADAPTHGARQYPLTTIDVEGHAIEVSVRVGHDGIEYVGRLWFAHPASEDAELATGIPDRAPIPGRTREDVIARAVSLDEDDIGRRHARALAERRRYRALRHTTDDVLARIRYMNRVALLVRDGLLDSAGGAQELDQTESQLHDLVAQLRTHAGLES
ncbi:MAG TPA: hypothetical protein VFJ74_06555 [Gemmatimonadaceae bacterium]|nr:hypothetical protein [Gemmatimonadaceae bacterium]